MSIDKDAIDWINHQLETRKDQSRGSLVPIRRRPWARVFALPTTRGKVYFKQVLATFGPEVILTHTLSRLVPQRVARVLAVEPRRGWVLMEDEGPTLEELLERERSQRAVQFEALITTYLTLQKELLPSTDRLRSLGVPEHGPHRLPRLYRELLGRIAPLPAKDATALERHHADYLRICDRLGETKLPSVLVHDDLDAGNVFYGAGELRLFDWGEAYLASPLFAAEAPLGELEFEYEFSARGEVMTRARRYFLDAWGVREEALDLALLIAPVLRAFSWQAIIDQLPRPLEDNPAIGCLREWLRRIEASKHATSSRSIPITKPT